MSRVRKIAIGAFVALLAATPFIPRGNDSDSAIRPSGERESAEPGAPGPGVLTGAMRREIDQVVAAGRDLGAVSARQSTTRLASDLVRCAEFDGQRYRLHTGWTTSTQADVRARVAAATGTVAARRVAAVETTGDLDLSDTLRRTAALSPAERAASERAERTAAARSVAKVWMLRHEIQGVPLPAGFSAAHPEAGLSARSSSTTATGTKTFHYPRVGKVLRWRRTAEQTTTYWCGPTTMQMIAWGWHGVRRSQGHWANRLGTTTSGTAITQMVRVVNESTGWDRASRAGTYPPWNSDWSFGKWSLLTCATCGLPRPTVLHPVLLKKYYPYLDDDASGHFQVGRGYNKNGPGRCGSATSNRGTSSGSIPPSPTSGRVQWRDAYRNSTAPTGRTSSTTSGCDAQTPCGARRRSGPRRHPRRLQRATSRAPGGPPSRAPRRRNHTVASYSPEREQTQRAGPAPRCPPVTVEPTTHLLEWTRVPGPATDHGDSERANGHSPSTRAGPGQLFGARTDQATFAGDGRSTSPTA